MIVVGLALLAAALQGQPGNVRQPLGVYADWGAFRDSAPQRCFAIARPVEPRRGGGYAGVATWPTDGVRNQLYIHLSRSRATQAKVTLSIGERRFELIAGPDDAWSPDSRTDAAIVAAMRSGRSMSVETLGAGGQPFADVYSLSGAATAIDAAAIRCARD